MLKAKEGSFINGFLERGRNGLGVEVSHLLFADDTLILCDASKEDLEYMSWIFTWFETISGLKINLEKSELILVEDVSNLEELVEILGCEVGSLPTTYLGLLLGAPHKSYRVWEGVEEHFQKRLALWKKQNLSKNGRHTLIKNILSSLPIYFMFLLSNPKEGSCETKKDSKGFSLGREGFDLQASFAELVCLLHGKTKKRVWASKTYPSLIRLYLGKWSWICE